MIFQPNFLYFKMAELVQNKPPGQKLIIGNEGGSRCFHADTLIVTDQGQKPISELEIGDSVQSWNEQINQIEVKKVADKIITHSDKPCFRIRLKNGKEIQCTQDHKFFFEGAWVEIKDIVSLWHGRNMETNSKV